MNFGGRRSVAAATPSLKSPVANSLENPTVLLYVQRLCCMSELLGNVKRLLWTGKAVFGGRARERLEGQQAPMLEIPNRLESDSHVLFGQ